MTREEIEKGVDELTRRCAETHDPEVKGKLEHLSHRPVDLHSHQIGYLNTRMTVPERCCSGGNPARE
jgi:hypothetical protein